MITLRTKSMAASVLAAGVLLAPGATAVASSASTTTHVNKRSRHGVRHHRVLSRSKATHRTSKRKAAHKASKSQATRKAIKPKAIHKPSKPAVAPKASTPKVTTKAPPKVKAKPAKSRKPLARPRAKAKGKGTRAKSVALRRHGVAKHGRAGKRRGH